MPPKRATTTAPPSSASAAAKKKTAASVKKATSKSTPASSNKKPASSNKKRKAQDDESESDGKDDAKSAVSSTSKKPASKKVKGEAVAATGSSSGTITFPQKNRFDWIAALKATTDLPTAISICLASCPQMSINVKHAIKHHAPQIDVATFQATLNTMIKDGTVIKHEYNPGGGPRSTEYHLTAQLKCRNCECCEPQSIQRCSGCDLSFCRDCRDKFPKGQWSWNCDACLAEGCKTY